MRVISLLAAGPRWLPQEAGVAGTAGLAVGWDGTAGLNVGRTGTAGLTVWEWDGTDVPLPAGATLECVCARIRTRATKSAATAAPTARIQRRGRDGPVTWWLMVAGLVV